MKVLFKISGDLIYNEGVLEDIKEMANNYSEVELIYGFGTILSERLDEKKIPFSYINGIRETTNEGLKIAFEVSERIKDFLKNSFPSVKIISPVIQQDNKIVNTNGDDLILRNYRLYDKTIIYTLKGREKERFKEMNKVEIKEID